MSTPLKVFITGASSGIGRALAEHYAAQGAVLGLAARRASLLQDMAETLGGAVHGYPLDVTDAEALRDAATDFMAWAGTPEIL